MAPHADIPPEVENEPVMLPPPERPPMSANPPRCIVIGAGSRGNAYAKAITESTNGIVVGVVEPIDYKRQVYGQEYIWGKGGPAEGQEFTDWRQYVKYELSRREREKAGEKVLSGADAAFICVQDEMHKEVILGLAPLDLHIMCEKPLATRMEDCIAIYKSVLDSKAHPAKIFSIGHVLRYSPHNMLLRKLLLEEKVIGDLLSINHTEPVGWWHFTHSYVRGNWRKESTSAPSLLTKSCHDIDFLLWLLCSPAPGSDKPAHIPSSVSSSGALQYFNQTRKPIEAGDATSCLSCEYEPSCKFSAKKVYISGAPKALATGNTKWPVDIVVPDIEDSIAKGGRKGGEEALLAKLAEDYPSTLSTAEVQKKNWFGRCVYEADNDVCDDQAVIMTWDADPIAGPGENRIQALSNRGAKLATFHMVAFSEKVCNRHSNIYGTNGEIYADSETIVVHDFTTGKKKTHYPFIAEGGHGGGDGGLARQFVLAVDKVINHGQAVESAQKEFVGCSLEEIIRSHAMVFAAEEARRKKIVLDFPAWWAKEVASRLA